MTKDTFPVMSGDTLASSHVWMKEKYDALNTVNLPLPLALFGGGGDYCLACQPPILPSSRQTKGMDGSQTECLNLACIKNRNQPERISMNCIIQSDWKRRQKVDKCKAVVYINFTFFLERSVVNSWILYIILFTRFLQKTVWVGFVINVKKKELMSVRIICLHEV